LFGVVSLVLELLFFSGASPLGGSVVFAGCGAPRSSLWWCLGSSKWLVGFVSLLVRGVAVEREAWRFKISKIVKVNVSSNSGGCTRGEIAVYNCLI
jgi:hypothetical protein